MIKFGDYNELKVAREASFGLYLDKETGNTSDDILLPTGNIVGEKPKVGETVTVFIYRDSKDRLIATMKKPKVTVDNTAVLSVSSVTNFGAFVNFGLERDILVPKREMKFPLETGREYLFFVYEDKTGRLAASTEVGRYLETPEEEIYKVGDTVSGIVYNKQTNGTLEVAIDDMYPGIILVNEYFFSAKPGDRISGTVKKILEDGRISFTPRKKMIEAKEELSDTILRYLEEHDGFMPFNDKSTPDEIKTKWNSSKNYFKIALGNLMKKGLIRQDEKGTHLVKDEK
ncbi:S1 RNA-binding domain-containing protein [Proteiniclasticum sp.]|uniref:CvfB family protein n=1 Tax=Proteiniclasticum sp. TaxID=2053595 RepID=UPI000E921103|nr:S1-like domain-containing RNA-binding protein [Proteiniclasticum sp.]HBW14456.1 DNA-binding protein [Proteiniclasticum sp.]